MAPLIHNKASKSEIHETLKEFIYNKGLPQEKATALMNTVEGSRDVFASSLQQLCWTHLLKHIIQTGDKAFTRRAPYRGGGL